MISPSMKAVITFSGSSIISFLLNDFNIKAARWSGIPLSPDGSFSSILIVNYISVV
jgi:hypothetical protein